MAYDWPKIVTVKSRDQLGFIFMNSKRELIISNLNVHRVNAFCTWKIEKKSQKFRVILVFWADVSIQSMLEIP